MRLIVILLFFVFVSRVRAAYVLPYPSFMPGHKLYRISRIIDSMKSYWYWGDIAQSKYHQALSDKYLIEAKTLFEYKQYPLALDALRRSDKHFRKENSQMRDAHIAVLKKLESQLPQMYIWQDEKKEPLSLNLAQALAESIAIRNE